MLWNRPFPSRLALGAPLAAIAATTAFLSVPTDVQLPGTQPLQATLIGAASQCDNCHGGYDPVAEPARPWAGGPMAMAGRDPVFWATLAIAEQDFPGAGDLCLRCHAPRGWHSGRSEPTDGSALSTSGDADGVECGTCHQMVDPSGLEHTGVQSAPFLAHNGATPPQGFHGSGMLVLGADNNMRYGPYAATAARHPFVQSVFHRSSEFCGTCHDVSNPVTGDLAHNHGAQVPLAPGTFSGVPGTPVTTKAAFLNSPHRYGVVERTFSEHRASALYGTRVRDYPGLPAELRRGAIAHARQQALLAGPDGDHQDGTPRFFTCQTCHMAPVVGKGASQNNVPVRTDLAQHDLTGGSTWLPDLLIDLDNRGRLRLGGGLTTDQRSALLAARDRARASLRRAAALDVQGDTLRVVNLTGHKLITGYPEGRRMWLTVRWRSAQGATLRVDGDYGPLQVNLQGTPTIVQTLLDPHGPNTRVYQAIHGITQEWANQLLGLGLPPTLPLEYDRVTGSTALTLGQLAAQAPGTAHETLHFVLNNTVLGDNRIPPYGMTWDAARERNILPVPASQYGSPGPGGTFRHFDELALQPPAGAVRAEIELRYQSTSWEYVQFLLLANRGTSAFLAQTGLDLLDGWRNTGMAPPETMASNFWCRLPGTGEDLSLRTGVAGAVPDTTCGKQAGAGEALQFVLESPGGTFATALTALVFELFNPAAPPQPLPAFPGIRVDRIDGQIVSIGLPPGGLVNGFAVPPGMAGVGLLCQGIVIGGPAQNGVYAASPAHEIRLR